MLRLYNPRPRVVSNWIPGVLLAHGIAVLALVGLGVNVPEVVVWMAEAAQNEFVTPDLSTPARTLIARPVDENLSTDVN